jgi:hypothetical protein
MSRSLIGTEEAPYARKAIDHCRKKGAHIVIATAEACSYFNHPKQKKFLKDLGIRDNDLQFCDECRGNNLNQKECQSKNCIWDGKKCGSKTDKNGSIKGPMIQSVLSNFPLVDKNKVIFFDDLNANLQAAKNLGIQTQLASTNCKGGTCNEASGLTKEEFREGMKKVNNQPQICIFDIDHTLTSGSKYNPDLDFNWLHFVSGIVLFLSICSLFLLYV